MLLCKIKKLDVYCSRHLRSWFCGILLFRTRSGNFSFYRLGCFDGCSKLFGHLFLYGMVAGAAESVFHKGIVPENEKQAATALDKFIEGKESVERNTVQKSILSKDAIHLQETFEIPGAYYHRTSIAKVATPNPDWRKTVNH